MRISLLPAAPKIPCEHCQGKFEQGSSFAHHSQGLPQHFFHTDCIQYGSVCPKTGCSIIITHQNTTIVNKSYYDSDNQNKQQASRIRWSKCCSIKASTKIICYKCCPIIFALGIAIGLSIWLPKYI